MFSFYFKRSRNEDERGKFLAKICNLGDNYAIISFTGLQISPFKYLLHPTYLLNPLNYFPKYSTVSSSWMEMNISYIEKMIRCPGSESQTIRTN